MESGAPGWAIYMTVVPIYDTASAPHDAQSVLEEIRKKWGAVSPACAVLAANPALLRAQWEKHQVVMRPHERVSPLMKQAIVLAVSAHNGCSYCTWAHAAAAKRLGLSDDEIERVKKGSPSSEPLGALVQLAVHVSHDATRLDPALWARLRQDGFTDADLIEAVAVAAYFNEMNRLLDALGVEAPSVPAATA